MDPKQAQISESLKNQIQNSSVFVSASDAIKFTERAWVNHAGPETHSKLYFVFHNTNLHEGRELSRLMFKLFWDYGQKQDSPSKQPACLNH